MTSSETFQADDKARYKTHRERILDLLQEGRWVQLAELTAISRNHTARITELRELGHNIVKEHVGAGATQYRLTDGLYQKRKRSIRLDEVLHWVGSASGDDLEAVVNAIARKQEDMILAS